MRSFCVILMGKDTRQLFVFFVLSLISVNRTNKVVTIDIFHFYCHFNYILCVWLQKKCVQPKCWSFFSVCVCNQLNVSISHKHTRTLFHFPSMVICFFFGNSKYLCNKWVREKATTIHDYRSFQFLYPLRSAA